jgi:outer membrane protein W
MRKLTRIMVAVALLTISIIPIAAAQEAEGTGEPEAVTTPPVRNWVFRFGLVAVDTGGDAEVIVDPGAVKVDISGGGGAFIALERRVTPLLGVELRLLGMGSDLNVATGVHDHHWPGTDVSMLGISSLGLGVNFHIVNDRSVDLFVGPLIGFNHYSDLRVRTGLDDGWWRPGHNDWVTVRTKTDSEVTWGVRAGIDVLLGKKKRWSVGCGLEYMDADYEFERGSGEGRTEIGLDPVILSLGAGFRF